MAQEIYINVFILDKSSERQCDNIRTATFI